MSENMSVDTIDFDKECVVGLLFGQMREGSFTLVLRTYSRNNDIPDFELGIEAQKKAKAMLEEDEGLGRMLIQFIARSEEHYISMINRLLSD